jgi:hypothetical protein
VAQFSCFRSIFPRQRRHAFLYIKNA